MRVAIVAETWLPSVDGVVTRLRHTVDELTDTGNEVLVLAPTTGRAVAGARQLELPGLKIPIIDRRRRVAIPLARPIRTAVDRFDPDVVHVVNPVSMGWAALRTLAPLYPVVASFHTDLDAYLSRYRLGLLRPVLRSMMRNSYRRADLALATSPTGQRRLARLGVPARLWPPGVDVDTFSSTSPAGTVSVWPHIPDRLPNVICVGRLAPEKNLDLLADVLRAAQQSRLPWHLTFIGDGPERRRLHARFAGLPAAFAGSRTAAELADAYRRADAVIMPSLTETVGLVLLEAAACGAPIVAADTPVTRHTLHGYPAALVGADASPDGWAHAVASLLRRPRPTPATVASWRDVTAELTAAYRSVVHRRQLDRPRPAGSLSPAPSAVSAGRTVRRSCAADS